MKLIRFGDPGREKPGLQLEDGTRVDASAFGSRLRRGLLRRRRPGAPARVVRAPTPPGAARRRGHAPGPAGHAAEQDRLHRPQLPRSRRGDGGPDPEGAGHLLQGDVLPGRARRRPRDARAARRRWTGRSSSRSSSARAPPTSRKEDAPRHIAGYALHNDYSERSFQLEHGGQWSKGKSADTFAPLGPFLATPDEIPDPQALPMWLTVNGEQPPEELDREHDLRRPHAGQLPEPVHDPAARRRDQHGHARPGVGLGIKPEPVYLKVGRRRGAGHRRAGPLAAEGGAFEMKRYVLTLDLKDDPRADRRVPGPSPRGLAGGPEEPAAGGRARDGHLRARAGGSPW